MALFDNTSLEEDRQSDELAPGTTLLRGQYHIEKYMVRGGFGITYLASDSLERQYVIKECFPGALCGRAGGNLQPLSPEWADKYASILRHFLCEARRVAKLDHPNIVRVHQVFEENETAYMAMEVVKGEDLLSIVEDTPERLTPKVLDKALRDALNAISYIHGLGILHRDISPDNFLLDAFNHLTLIDFGAAREHAGRENRALSALLAVKDGYSPHEFYLTDVEQTASSDLYSLGATFYHLITGEAPPNSQDRVAALAADQPDPYQPLVDGPWGREGGYDRNMMVSIDRALEVLQPDRIRSAQDWIDMLDAEFDEPAPVVNVALDGDLTRVISRLVEDTNKKVNQGMPGDAAQMAEERARLRRERTRRVVIEETRDHKVDIFGNPISNVEAWMREQNRGANALPKAVQAPIKPGKEPKQKTPQVRKARNGDRNPSTETRSTIAKLFTACLPMRRVSATTPIHN